MLFRPLGQVGIGGEGRNSKLIRFTFSFCNFLEVGGSPFGDLLGDHHLAPVPVGAYGGCGYHLALVHIRFIPKWLK